MRLGLTRSWSGAISVALCMGGFATFASVNGIDGALGVANAQSVQTFELSVAIPPGLHPRSVTLAASGRLLLRDRARALGPISNLGTGEMTELGADSIVQDVYSEQSLTLRDRAAVSGAIISASVPSYGNNVVVQGDVLSGASFANPGGKTFLAEWPSTSEGNVFLEPDQVRTLVPGRAYERIEVKSRSKLVLPPGTYHIRDLVVHPQAEVILGAGTQSVEVFVKNEFTWRGTVIDLDDAEFPDWMVGVIGSQRVVIEQQFKGLIVAPHAEITLARVNAGFHEGQFFGRHIEVHPDTLIKYHTSDFLLDPPAVISLDIPDDNQCTSSNLLLVNEEIIDGETRYGGVSLVDPEPGCESVSFCAGEEGEGAPIDVEDFFSNPPFTEDDLVECGPEDGVPASDCPIDSSTIDWSTSCNSDSDCPNYLDGELCAQACTDIYCEETESHCAYRAECDGLEGDAAGCAPTDIWHCSEPTPPYSIDDLDLAIAGFDVGTGLALPVPLGTVEQYGPELLGPCDGAEASAVNAWEGDRGDPFNQPPSFLGYKWSEVGEPEIGGHQNAIDTELGVLESFINQKWGFQIYSRLFRWEHIQPEFLDLDHAYTQSQAALLTVVKLNGTDFSLLDVGAKAAADICGYDANSATLLLGSQVSGFDEFGGISQINAALCQQEYENLMEQVAVLHRYMYAARRAMQLYESGDTAALCVLYERMLFQPIGFDCSAQVPVRMVNALVNGYKTHALTVASARQEFINGRFANEGSRAIDQDDVLDTELKGGDWEFPVGPLTVTVGYRLLLASGAEKHATLRSEHDIVNGKREPRLESAVRVTPNVGVDVTVTGGVGIGRKASGVSVSATGRLELIEAEFPMAARATLERSTGVDQRDVFASVYAGGIWPFELPYADVTSWEGNSNFGMRANLSAFDGSITAKARAKFKIKGFKVSLSFKRKVAEWEGIQGAKRDLIGNWPLDQEWPTANVPDDFGEFEDPVAFLSADLVGDQSITGDFLSVEPDRCVIVR